MEEKNRRLMLGNDIIYPITQAGNVIHLQREITDKLPIISSVTPSPGTYVPKQAWIDISNTYNESNPIPVMEISGFGPTRNAINTSETNFGNTQEEVSFIEDGFGPTHNRINDSNTNFGSSAISAESDGFGPNRFLINTSDPNFGEGYSQDDNSEEN